jgi:hypothetical protein
MEIASGDSLETDDADESARCIEEPTPTLSTIERRRDL